MYSIRRFRSFAFPAPCPMCSDRTRAGALCDGCEAELVGAPPGAFRCRNCGIDLGGPESSSRCPACAAPDVTTRAYDRTITVIDYAYPADMLITLLKERGRLDIAVLLGRLLAQALDAQAGSVPALGALVPVPASLASLRRRGFNPAGEIARALSIASGVPLKRNWLACVRSTPSQKTLDRAARWCAPDGTFSAREGLPGIWVGLVDDVMTTGSTLHHAATALRGAGIAGVIALVAARTPARLWHNDGHVRRDPGSA